MKINNNNNNNNNNNYYYYFMANLAELLLITPQYNKQHKMNIVIYLLNKLQCINNANKLLRIIYVDDVLT